MFSRWDALLAALVFLVALWVNLSAVATTEFHRDEARWVHRARFLEELRNPTGEFWRESELMIGQPPLGSYLMGLGLTAAGARSRHQRLLQLPLWSGLEPAPRHHAG